MSSLSDLLVPGCRVGVVGSRDFPDPSLVECFVVGLPACVVVSGSGGVVDLTAAAAARDAALELIEFPAEWIRFGRAAGMVRNKKIVAAVSVLVVFLSDLQKPSPGSAGSMRLARAAGIPVFVFGPDGAERGGGKKPVNRKLQQLTLF